MKSKLFLVGATMLLFAACSQDPTASPSGGEVENGATTTKSDFSFLAVDQSRIVTPDLTRGVSATRANEESKGAQLLSEVLAAAAEAAAIPDVQWGTTTLQEGSYIINTKGYTSDIALSGNATIYVDAPNVKLGNIASNGNTITVYVLPGADLTWADTWNATKIMTWTSIYSWGNLTLNKINDWALFEVEGTLHLYQAEGSEDTFTVVGGTSAIFQLSNGSDFYCEQVADIYASVKFQSNAHFVNDLQIHGNAMWDTGVDEVTLDGCTVVEGQFYTKSNTGTKLYINKGISVGSIMNDGGTMDIYMTGACFDIGSNFEGAPAIYDGRDHKNYLYDKEGSYIKFHGLMAPYYSIINVDPNAPLYISRGNNYETDGDGQNGTTGEASSFVTELFDGYVNVNSVKFINGEPKYVGKTDLTEVISSDDPNVLFNNGNVVVPEDACHSHQPSTGATIRPPYDEGDTPSDDPFTSEHKYSATGLDFNGDYVYVSWHSNLHNGGEADHKHGTNADYGYPSVDNAADWGGIIDVISIDDYNPNTIEGIYVQSVLNKQHKYNHVKYAGGKLYLASTSNKVGAALNVIELENGLIPASVAEDTAANDDGAANEEKSYRINLTGYSANCVELNGSNVWTISGHTYGAINLFAADTEVRNQTKLYCPADAFGVMEYDTVEVPEYKNGTTTEEVPMGYKDFGGKYIVVYNGKVYALHNTESAVVSVLSTSGTWENDIELGVALAPYDGKNVMQIADDKIYVCCGKNGLNVFDMSGTKLATSSMNANGCDVKAINGSTYVFTATGSGVAAYEVLATEPADATEGILKRVGYKTYTGPSFIYPGTSTQKVPDDGEVKQSSNFVKIHGNNVYVAYGMYGLRVYSLADLLPQQE